METQSLKEIFQRYLDNNYTARDFQIIQNHFQSESERDLLLGMITDELNSELSNHEDARIEQILRNTDTKVLARIKEANKPNISIYQSVYFKIAVAAAVAFVVIGVYFFKTFYKGNDNKANASIADVAPGKNGATLTLANGTKILVNDALAGDIASQAGVNIIKGKDGQIIYEITGHSSGKLEYNTLTTTRGEQTQVRLPDGSLVFLNAASSLKYPTSFVKARQRRVSLTGEGYFEISKDKAYPFIVETSTQEVEVLGTHFNINAYADEPAVATTLIEGLVKVRSTASSLIIKPGEQAVNNGLSIRVASVNLESVSDWKDGDFVLNDMNFKTAMREIARWYDVQVIYDESVTDGLQSGGWISRNTNLSEVLTLIEKSGLVQFRLEGRKLYVSRKASSK